jgi:ATP-dependent HslUV protease subunit HslV
MDIPELSAEEVARKAMKIATDMCVYTNDHYTVETLDTKEDNEEDAGKKSEDAGKKSDETK